MSVKVMKHEYKVKPKLFPKIYTEQPEYPAVS